MLKVLASILMVAQLATLATPILAAAPASPHAPACAQISAEGTVSSAAMTKADCQGCELPDCHALHGCAGAAPAIANQVTVQLDLSFAASDDAEFLSRHVVGDYTPTSPPPRA